MLLTFLTQLFLVLFSGCEKEPINYEIQLYQNDNIFYQRNHSEPYNGSTFSLYLNGQEKNNGNLLNGKKDGPWIEWYENGNKKGEEKYKNGKAHGVWLTWHENNTLKLKGSFENGSAIGLRTEWYENGNKKKEGFFKNNK